MEAKRSFLKERHPPVNGPNTPRPQEGELSPEQCSETRKGNLQEELGHQGFNDWFSWPEAVPYQHHPMEAPESSRPLTCQPPLLIFSLLLAGQLMKGPGWAIRG